MSLKLKMALLFSGVIFLTVGGFSAILVWREKKILLDDIVRRQRAEVENLAEVCRGSLMANEDLFLTNYMRRMKTSPAIVEALCLDSNARVAGHTDVALSRTIMDTPRGREALAAAETTLAPLRDLVQGTAPVRVGDKRIGAAIIVFNLAVWDEILRADLTAARRRILKLSVPILLAGFALTFWATAFLIRPLQHLARGAQRIGEGKLDHRIPVGAGDEIGLLGREFNRMAEKLGELDRMKQDFVNSITHDLKSPLATVKAASDVVQRELEKSGRPAVAVENLGLIRHSADRLLNLVTSILEVAHIESGLKLRLAEVALEDVAQRVVASYRLIAEQKGLTLEFLMETELSPIQADEGRMERVFSNLVGNAVKFTDKGGVIVSAREKGGGVQSFQVKDTGPGIAPSFQDKLFAKFTRSAEASGKEGAGLGLSIAKGIVEAHGGRMRVESAPGKGTIFSFDIPVRTA